MSIMGASSNSGPPAEGGPADDDAFLSDLRQLVGLEAALPEQAPDEVNAPMIRHLVEVIGDRNPVYVDPEYARGSVHGGVVAPPTMLQAWVMPGIDGPRRGDGAYDRLTRLLASRGFTSVVATDSEQVYHRYLHPGDRLTMRTVIDAVSGEKSTALGVGHFVTTRQDYFDAGGELVASMTFRVLRFRPVAAERAPIVESRRPRPVTTPDNRWWFEALAGGRLSAQRCSTCGTLRFPAGPTCVSCLRSGWIEVPLPLSGTIHSFVVTHAPRVPGFDYPLPILLVDVDSPPDGRPGDRVVRMVMNTLDGSRDGIAIGARVRIEIRDADDGAPPLKLPFAVVTRPGAP